MEKESDFVAVLQRAQAMGALQPMEESAVDLGIKITVKGVLFDSIRTLIGFDVTDDVMGGYVPSKASLTDMEQGISYCLLGVKQITSGTPFPWFLEFEPVLPGTTALVLTVEELQVVAEGYSPQIKTNTINDPWDPLTDVDPAVIEKLQQWREELQTPQTEIPPVWECTGQWRYQLYPNLSYREYYSRAYDCFINLPIIGQSIKISKIISGISGSLLFCDSFFQTMNDDEWENWKAVFVQAIEKSKNPMDFANNMKMGNINVFRPMFFKITVASKTNGYIYPTTGSGPWGIFNTRFYYFCDSVEDPKNLVIRIEELFNLSLAEPWEFPIEIRDVEYNQELPFSLSSNFLNVDGTLSVEEIHYGTEYILLNHQIHLFTGNVSFLRFRDMRIFDREGVPYPPIDKSSHWSEKHGKMLRGVSFPPVHFKGSLATLEISTIDVAPIVPFQFDAVF